MVGWQNVVTTVELSSSTYGLRRDYASGYLTQHRNQEAFEIAEKLRSEYVIQVTGEVAYRGEGLENPNKTGKYELLVDEVEVFSKKQNFSLSISMMNKNHRRITLEISLF